MEHPQILIYGYGNPGRQDDGVGNAVVDELEGFIRERYIPGVSFDSNYQLNIEDATVIYGKDLVIFVDATTEVEVEHFKVTRVQPDPKVEFTMHAVSPSFVLNLCHDLYHEEPDTYLVHVRGYQWEFLGNMTRQAEDNVLRVKAFIKDLLLLKELLPMKEYLNNFLS